MQLTIDDLKPGRYYLVQETGDADPSLTNGIVLGAASHLDYAAVTVWTPDGDWLGTTWHATRHADTTPDYVDEDARFIELTPEQYVLTIQQPQPATVDTWCCTTCGGTNVFQDAFVNMNDPDDVRTYDETFCEDCDGPCRAELREVQEN